MLNTCGLSASSATASTQREIVTLYDRWVRTDLGGFRRILKSVIAILEDLDTVEELPEMFPGNLGFTEDIVGISVGQLKEKRLSNLLAEGWKCIETMKTTRDASERFATTARGKVKVYVEKMAEGMSELIDTREKILMEIETKKFGSDFDILSLFLLVVAETGENYIPLNCGFGPKSYEEVKTSEWWLD